MHDRFSWLGAFRWQAIIWTNAGTLLIGPLGTNLSKILIEIHTFSLKKMHLKMPSAIWCLFLLCLNVVNAWLEELPNDFTYVIVNPECTQSAVQMDVWPSNALEITVKFGSCDGLFKREQSYNLNQLWIVVNRLLDPQEQTLNQNSNIFSQENSFCNTICQKAAMCFQPRCAKEYYAMLQWGWLITLFRILIFMSQNC